MSLARPEPLSCSANGPYEGIVDEEVQFDGCASGGQTPYDFLWDFGDGATSTEEDPTHIYTEPGEFTVSLTVTDGDQTQVTDETTATIQGYPILDVRPLTGGLLRATGIIRNQGTAEAANVDWTITVSGGLILLGGTNSGTIASIPADGQATIETGLIFGLSLSVIFTVTAEEDSGSSDTREQTGAVLLFFVNVNPGGG
jgi:PKD repeat protein